MKCSPRSTGEASVIEQNNTCSLPYNHLHSSYWWSCNRLNRNSEMLRAQIKFGVDKATDNKSLATHLPPTFHEPACISVHETLSFRLPVSLPHLILMSGPYLHSIPSCALRQYVRRFL